MSYNVKDLAIDAMKGQVEYAPEHVAVNRMTVCKGCEHFQKLMQVCLKCGCYLPGKTKFSKSSCPVGKWDAV